MGPASSSALRADSGAASAAPHGSNELAFGSLAGIGGPRKFKKTPVLVLDPEELERAHLLFQEASAELLGEEVVRPARPSSILGLAAMDDEDSAADEAADTDDEIVEEEDEALPSAEEVLRMTAPRAPVEADPQEDAFAAQMLEDGLDIEHRIFPSLPMKSEDEIAAEEEAERAAIRAAVGKADEDDEPEAVYTLPDDDFDDADWDEDEPAESTAALPSLSLGSTHNAAPLGGRGEDYRPDLAARVPDAYVPQIPPPLADGADSEGHDASPPLPDFGWTAPVSTPSTTRFAGWHDAFDHALPSLPGEPVDFTPQPEPEPELPPQPEPFDLAFDEPEAEPMPEPGFSTFDDFEPEEAWAPAAEPVEADGEPEADPSWTSIEDEPVDGYAFMYANSPRARTLHALAEGEANSLRARLLREREQELAQAEQGERRPALLRLWDWLRGLFD